MIFDKGIQTVPKGTKVLGVVAQGWTCVVDKVIGELAPYMEPYRIGVVMANEDKGYDPVVYIPEWVMYFRAGAMKTGDFQMLANLETYTGLYRGIGIPVIYYIDDAVFFENNSAPLKLIKACDKAIVSSTALAEYLLINQEYKNPTYILKTHMDLNSFDLLQTPDYLVKKGMFNILFTSQGRIGSLMLRRIVERMDQAPEKYHDVNLISVSVGVAQIRSIINEFRHVHKTYYEYIPNPKEFYSLAKGCQMIIAPGEVGDLDYLIAPEAQPLWLDAKSCVKYLLAGASRIPCIASPLREYKAAIRHGENGFIATTIDEWMALIDLCIGSKGICDDVGRQARADVESNWDARQRAKQLVDILEENGDECLCTLDKEGKDAETTDIQSAIGSSESTGQELSGVETPNQSRKSGGQPVQSEVQVQSEQSL